MAELTAAEAFALADSIRKRITIFNRKEYQDILIKRIKAPLCKILKSIDKSLSIIGLIGIAIELYKIRNLILNDLPTPDFTNTRHPNLHALIRMQNKFFSRLNMPSREKELRMIWKFFIIEYGYNTPYHGLINRALELWQEEKWVFDDPGEPKKYWKEE